MREIEFVPDSVDDDAAGPVPARLPRIPARLVGILATAIVCVTAVVVTARQPAPMPVAAPPAHVIGDLGSGFRSVLPGREPVLDVAAVASSSWALRRDGIFVVRPRRPVARIALPAAVAAPRLVADAGADVVWLVGNGLARAYDGRTLDVVFDGWAPPCDNATAMDGRLFVTNDVDLVEVGPGLRVPLHAATAPGPIAAIAADPSRHRLIVAYLGAPSRILAIVPRRNGPARVERAAPLAANEPTLAVAGGRIWLAGYDSVSALVRLDPVTLRPVGGATLGAALGLGAYLAGAGASTVWVRGTGDAGELRCLDATDGRQLQTWLLDGRVASAARHAVVAAPSGALVLDLGLCRG